MFRHTSTPWTNLLAPSSPGPGGVQQAARVPGRKHRSEDDRRDGQGDLLVCPGPGGVLAAVVEAGDHAEVTGSEEDP